MSSPEKALGWRKRIGVLSPTVIETASHDFHRMAPDGVSMCAITSNVEHWDKENFKQSVLDPLVADVLREKSPTERTAMIFDTNRTMRRLIAGRLRTDHPDWSDEEVSAEVARRMLHGPG